MGMNISLRYEVSLFLGGVTRTFSHFDGHEHVPAL